MTKATKNITSTPGNRHERPALAAQTKARLTHQAEALAYRVSDAARVLGIGRTSLYELFASGALTPVRIAGRVLVPADQLRRLVADATKKTA